MIGLALRQEDIHEPTTHETSARRRRVYLLSSTPAPLNANSPARSRPKKPIARAAAIARALVGCFSRRACLTSPAKIGPVMGSRRGRAEPGAGDGWLRAMPLYSRASRASSKGERGAPPSTQKERSAVTYRRTFLAGNCSTDARCVAKARTIAESGGYSDPEHEQKARYSSSPGL